MTPSNIVRPAPRTTGITSSWYESTSPAAASCATIEPLPRITRGPSASPLSLRVSAARSPVTSIVLFQGAAFSVRENTTLGSSFICLATTGSCAAACGVCQKPAISS